MDITHKLPKLKGEQCEILYLPRYSNQVVLGVAGSGKSIEAICRATWIGMTNPNDKVMVLSFNHDVNDEMKNKLHHELKDFNYQEFNSYFKGNVHVRTIYSYCLHLINTYDAKRNSNLAHLEHIIPKGLYGYRATKKDDDTNMINDAISDIKEKYPSSTLWSKRHSYRFIYDEIAWMQSNRIDYNNDLDHYLNADRIGRNNDRISQPQRRIMYYIYSQYYKIRLKAGKLFSFNDIYRLIPNLNISNDCKPKYIVVDEVQDVSPIMFDALRHVLKDDGYWDVFGDVDQNIFGQRISWRKALGINLNKGRYLRINYRNSYEICSLAIALLSNKYFRNSTFNKRNGTAIYPVHHCSKQGLPILSKYMGNNTIVKLSDHIKQYLNRNNSIAIICMNGKDMQYIGDELKNVGIDCAFKIKYFEPGKNILIQTINQIKGLEFDDVIVYGIDSSQFQDRQEIVNDDNTLDIPNTNDSDRLIISKRLYVAITRARKHLILIYKNDDLSILFNGFKFKEE